VSEKRTPAGIDLRERIDAYLQSSGLVARNPRVVPLTGDASDRRYFRILLESGPEGPQLRPDRPEGPQLRPGGPEGPQLRQSGPESIVLAVHTGPIEFATLPFANVSELLARMEVPAPEILGHSDPLGIVALQDLGDVTLQAHLGAASVTEHASLYREAVALIHNLQARGQEFASERYLPYTLAFDVEKLTWELEFFVRHFLEAYRGLSLGASERVALSQEWAAIAGELAAEPRVVCHRDYHSRNLMLHRGRLYMIDFQDARLGPDTYDLVSLLRDSYVDITDRELDDLVAYFLALAGGRDPVEFRRRFDLMAVQRNLKALGTFGFQTTTRANPVYIQYMPRTLHYVRGTLEKHHRFARLRGLLAAHLEELR
jgi:aminoglycoside/choline kinase family phosphotransferase